ncbi:hypothetical protein [Agromyces seonyuensis]|uniref:Uncharacterized protein n=1 Tax=Agromyces seonyuensis TaxID=2662446 RepID=A0A6I4NZZ6_9MICO|nr:hypothetical protein [Agromyces seonyuensis]MWB98055.1 hypothetical protein [Agromyces seonyuensis]
MSSVEIASLIGELLSWIGLPLGLLLLIIVFVVHAFDGGWEDTEIVLVETPEGRIARWFAGNEFFERTLHHDEARRIGDATEFPAYTARNSPSTMRLERRRPAMHLLRTLALLFLGIGFLGLVVSTAGLFIEA